MEFATIKPTALERTSLKAEFYGREFRSASDLLRKQQGRKTLEQIRDSEIPIRRGIDMPSFVQSEGAPLLVTIASFSDPGISFADLERIDRNQHEKFQGSKLRPGDLLVAMGGYVGAAAIVPSNCPDANIGRHTARIVVDYKKADKYFVWAYIRSRIGTRLFAREVTGSVQAGINLEDLREIEIPTPAATAQKYIGDKVRQAERLREIAQNQIQGVTSTIDELTPVYDSIPNAISRVSPQRFGSRLDCQPYRTHFLALQAALETMTVNSLWEIADVLPGDPVPSDEFVRSGVPLVRIRDINAAGFQTAETFVSASYSQSRPAGSAKPNDIVIGMDGEFRAQLILAEDLPRHINQRIGIVRATGIAPELLSFWLNRTEGQFQLNQWSVKTTVDHTSLEYIRAVRIPRLSNRIEEQLASSLKRSSLANYYSKVCIDAAKLLVEALIERKVTEDELIHAQTRLEQGDDSADRAILSRLFEGGWDATGTRPLFPDFDAYYETLRMVEREQTEAAAK
jgi:type I restriction enzyme S subunit